MSRWQLNVLLVGWSCVAIVAALAHLILPEWTAQGTTWPSSPHWQREIAYFDLLLAYVFISIARQGNSALKIRASWAIAFLSLVLGHNHLQGWLNEPKIFHLIFTVGNFIALVFAIACIYIEKRRSDKSTIAARPL